LAIQRKRSLLGACTKMAPHTCPDHDHDLATRCALLRLSLARDWTEEMVNRRRHSLRFAFLATHAAGLSPTHAGTSTCSCGIAWGSSPSKWCTVCLSPRKRYSSVQRFLAFIGFTFRIGRECLCCERHRRSVFVKLCSLVYCSCSGPWQQAPSLSWVQMLQLHIDTTRLTTCCFTLN
jgi:hypothetical protein